MGVCCCKKQESRESIHSSFDDIRRSRDRRRKNRDGEASNVDLLVLEALSVLRSLADNDEAPPECMNILHSIAEEEDGWLTVVKSCIFAMPLGDTLGSAVVCLLLDECPLPSRGSIRTLSTRLNLSKRMGFLAFKTNKDSRVTPVNPAICRNVLVVLSCLAEKLAGPLSISLLTEGTLEFLLDKVDPQKNPAVVLHAILAIEKFGQTSENKLTISAAGIAERLQLVERVFLSSSDILEHEAGFCAQWTLDNTFPYPVSTMHVYPAALSWLYSKYLYGALVWATEGRPFSYENVDVSTINCMLNNNDVSEYLKISPTGLEARCDAASFESVRCTSCVSSGVWYYEVTLLTAGVMQIGWATKDSKFLNHEGYGIGDDEFSCAYDGCRRLIWHAARSSPNHQQAWAPGDVLGVLLDMNRGRVGFSLNNCSMEVNFPAARSGAGFFAGASFMSYQHCIFNFGSNPFRFPPSLPFNNFNDHAQMAPEDKVILPRHLKLAAIRQESITENPCKICFHEKADTRLEPCQHGELCMTCALQMLDCPLCRKPIAERVFDNSHSPR